MAFNSRHSALGTRHYDRGEMAWLNGRVERHLVTALLLVALLVSCGIAGRARQLDTADPAAATEEPTAVAVAPSSDVPPSATIEPSGEPSVKPSVAGAPSGQPVAPPPGTPTATAV